MSDAPPRFQRRAAPYFALNAQEAFTDHGSAESWRQTGLSYGRGQGRAGSSRKDRKTEMGEEFRVAGAGTRGEDEPRACKGSDRKGLEFPDKNVDLPGRACAESLSWSSCLQFTEDCLWQPCWPGVRVVEGKDVEAHVCSLSERRCVVAEMVAGALWEEAGWWGRYLRVRIPGKGGLLQGESTGAEGNTAPKTWTCVTRRMEVDGAIGSRWGEQSLVEII